MKRLVLKEPLLNTLARKVGRAAGTIAKATQQLAADAAAMVQTDKINPARARRKATQTSKLRPIPKRKTKIAKSAARKSRTRVRTRATTT